MGTIEIAKAYRSEAGREKEGLVVIYKEKAVGWIDKLRDPQRWSPGALAVDPLGNIWQATGSNCNCPAESWTSY